jgi:transglutaminase-like putative cysteine protease
MMFWPRSSRDLRVIAGDLRITPTPEQVHWSHDVFDNSVTVATFTQAASELVFESEVTIEHFEAPSPEYQLEPYAAVFPVMYTDEEAGDLVRARSRPHPDKVVDEWARGFLSPDGSTSTMALLRAMTNDIRASFTYERRVQKGVFSPVETLRNRRGTCRDYAVLMIDAVRSLGFAARYVSGYIFVPNHEPVEGGGSTHAWLQVYLPGAGWVDFDPTNSIVGNRHLIRVAVAWNHEQALPLHGTWYGSAHTFRGLEVSVHVEQSPEEPEVEAASPPIAETKEIYRSPNGDLWSLITDGAGKRQVKHDANKSSGGHVTLVSLEDFLARKGGGPEHQALEKLLKP